MALPAMPQEGGGQARRTSHPRSARILALTIRCRCRDCRTGDALPAHLQGIPGAYQTTFIVPGWAGAVTVRSDTMPLPTFADEKLRSACQDRCADYGDPPCYELDDPTCHKPCADCLRDIGIEPGDEFDENAAIGRML
jgi:hypothetical protein